MIQGPSGLAVTLVPSRPHLLGLLSLLSLLGIALGGCGGVGAEPRTTPLDAAEPTVRTTELGGTPGALAVGEDAVWVADATRGRLVAVGLRSGEVEGRPVAVPAPLGLASGEGAVWVAAGTGAISRVDPTTRRRSAVARVADPGGIAAGLGSVWVTSRRDGTVTALDPRTGRPRGAPVRTGDTPGDVRLGFGSAWVANTGDGTVTRIDARSRRPVGDPIRVSDAQVLSLAVGEGAVWAAATDSAQNARVELRRIEPDGGEVGEDAVALPTGLPLELAAGLGSVWATDAGNVLPGTPPRRAAVRRIDARERVPAGAPVPLPAAPGGVAVGAGAVWVTTSGDGALRRIVPGAVDRSAR